MPIHHTNEYANAGDFVIEIVLKTLKGVNNSSARIIRRALGDAVQDDGDGVEDAVAP